MTASDSTPSAVRSGAADVVREHAIDVAGDPAALVAALALQLDVGPPSDADIWLAWTAIRGELPREDDVIALRRSIALNGAMSALTLLGGRTDATVFGPRNGFDVVTGAILVDVTHASSTDSISGIQRVVRETVRRWDGAHPIVLVSWTSDYRALRHLTSSEYRRIREVTAGTISTDVARGGSDGPDDAPALVLPVGGLYIVAEIAAEPERAERILALGRFAQARVAAIGYDIVPLTSGETATPAMATLFPLYLEALSYADRIGTISTATATEFQGWKRMLSASGKTGPDIRAVFLGGDSPSPLTGDDSSAAEQLGILEGEPLVLAVGSHEPRKNHLSILTAARSLWNQGLSFRLVFIGSGTWSNEGFSALAEVMIGEGHHLQVLTGSTDEHLAAAYRLADVTIFTSTHEGFGLPIVESLRSGTPVIASDVGSMREIAEHYTGVVQVNPHDDRALERELTRLLTSRPALDELTTAARANSFLSWDDYADELWDYLTA
ncbi:MAG: glycosyltransferase family 1 protein [Herbiconiux sp.]|uniref:glycosyltransferase family 4 protein n=1 Tax=Herbiconiux sp. TaxID=1871186 RepID=UPI0012058087|nr:glycosyltransferase family 1 protein [Herbiconiux sp.]TAJ49317.1 MAG: glycosyltransferase family 1 protein [Herbiconiux sp.]